MNGNASGQDDRTGAVPLPPAVTHWRNRNTRNKSEGGMAPPFRASRQSLREDVVAEVPTEPLKPAPADDFMAELIAASEEEAQKPSMAVMPERRPVAAPEVRQESPKAQPVNTPVPIAVLGAAVEADLANELVIEADSNSLAHELADRLAAISQRLRTENIESLMRSLAHGDRFDALLAGFLAGYFPHKNG